MDEVAAQISLPSRERCFERPRLVRFGETGTCVHCGGDEVVERGTTGVRRDTLDAGVDVPVYVRDVVGSLASHGWDRVVPVNGHGGNAAALREVAGKIPRHDDAHAVPFALFEEVGEHSSDMGHRGPLETSLLQRANPETVRDELLDRTADALVDLFQTVADSFGDAPSES